MDTLFSILLLSLPFLLLASYLMTAKSKSFWRIFTAHAILFILYMTFVIFFSKTLTGHDEYGLRQLFIGILCIIVHVIIGFTHALFITIKNDKLNR